MGRDYRKDLSRLQGYLKGRILLSFGFVRNQRMLIEAPFRNATVTHDVLEAIGLEPDSEDGTYTVEQQRYADFLYRQIFRDPLKI